MFPLLKFVIYILIARLCLHSWCLLNCTYGLKETKTSGGTILNVSQEKRLTILRKKTFISPAHERQFTLVENRRLIMERKVSLELGK